MEKKKNFSDFIQHLYAVYWLSGFSSIKLNDIDRIISIALNVSEFSDLKKYFNLKTEMPMDDYISSCSIGGDIEEDGTVRITLTDLEAEEINAKDTAVKDLIIKIIEAGFVVYCFDSFDFCSSNFSFESPNSNCDLGVRTDIMSPVENVFFTDGDVIETDLGYRIIDDMGVQLCNVKTCNATYSLVLTLADNRPYSIVGKSDFLSDGFIVQEAKNVLMGKISHYKQINKGKVKIYKLYKN